MAHVLLHWQKEPGARVAGSRDLDRAKVQAPCIVRTPDGRYRLFYTAVGPAKPFADCQGYILSATSGDGLAFTPEPGIRIAPDPLDPPMSLRVLAPSVAALPDGTWRMYVESRGPATTPTTIRSAHSPNLIDWTLEPGTRLATPGGVGAPRFRWRNDGTGELLCIDSRYADGGPGRGARTTMAVIRATTTDGLSFAIDPDDLMRDRQTPLDSAGINAAEINGTTPPQLLNSA